MDHILYEGQLPKLIGNFRLIMSSETYYIAEFNYDYMGKDSWHRVSSDGSFTHIEQYIYTELYKKALANLYKLSKLKAFI